MRVREGCYFSASVQGYYKGGADTLPSSRSISWPSTGRDRIVLDIEMEFQYSGSASRADVILS